MKKLIRSFLVTKKKWEFPIYNVSNLSVDSVPHTSFLKQNFCFMTDQRSMVFFCTETILWLILASSIFNHQRQNLSSIRNGLDDVWCFFNFNFDRWYNWIFNSLSALSSAFLRAEGNFYNNIWIMEYEDKVKNLRHKSGKKKANSSWDTLDRGGIIRIIFILLMCIVIIYLKHNKFI